MKFVDTYKQMNTSFTDTFSPLMKLVSDSKEKENVEIAIAMMDKVSIYNSKLSQMQQLLYATGQKVGTETIAWLSEKYKNPSFQTSLQPLFNEWVNLNEKLYSDLFATDEFSALKAELTTISMEIKQHLEKQFENRVESLPLVVKSEMNELYKTIHDLKQTVKSMETKISSIATAPKTTTARKTTTV
jgi:polyhydroxyalkanoate synthesis regulator phasin